MLRLPTDLPREFRYKLNLTWHFNSWRYDYILIGAKGGLNLHIDGPHNWDEEDHWSVELEIHSRTPLQENVAPSHDECWLLKCPCWHGGTTLYAEKKYLPLFLSRSHDLIFYQLVRDAKDHW